MADFIDRLGQACARAEYELPRLAAPDGTVAVQIADLRAALTALSAKPEAGESEGLVEQGSDWFKGEVDCDGNPLVTVPEYELQRLRDDREKFLWQVRDTCTRAEKAEATIQSLQAMLAQFVAWADGSDDKPHSLTEDARKLLRKLDGERAPSTPPQP